MRIWPKIVSCILPSLLVVFPSFSAEPSKTSELEPTRFEQVQAWTTRTTRGLVDDSYILPDEYLDAVRLESDRALQRRDSRIIFSSPELSLENRTYMTGPILERDLEQREDLAREILKDSWKEARTNLPTLREVSNQINGFFKKKFQLEVEPKIKLSEQYPLSPEVEQELRKQELEDKEAVSVGVRGSLRRGIHNLFGQQTGFSQGVKVHSIDDLEYFVFLTDPEIIEKRFKKIRLGYSFLEPAISAEFGRGIGFDTYLNLTAENTFSPEQTYSYSLSFDRVFDSNSASLVLSTTNDANFSIQLQYNAQLPCRLFSDLKRFLLRKR